MKIIKSDNGYALVLTLIIVTIILLFLSSFTIRAMNLNKQVKNTDNTYEATAIAEMGVEYYQAKIKSEINQAIKDVEAIIADNSGNKLSQINERYNSLKTTLISSSIYNPKLVDTSKGFFLINNSDSPKITEDNGNNKSSLAIEVEGYVGGKKQIIVTKFDIPTSLLSYSETGNESNNIYKNIVTPPTFPNTDSTGINNCPLSDTVIGSNNLEYICKSSSLDKLAKILNLNLYYTGQQELQNLNDNFSNLNNFYANYGVKIGNLKPKENSSYYIKGDTVIDTIDFPKNLTLYSTGNIEVNSLNNMSKINIYSGGKITFKNAINFNNMKLFAKEVSFNNLNNTNENLQIQVNGNVEFSEINTINNSNMVINGEAIFNSQNQAVIKGNSTLMLDSIKFKFPKNNILRLEDTSKVCIRNVDYEDVKHTIQGTKHTKLIMLVKDQKDVKSTGHNEWVLESDFNTLCKSSGDSDSFSSLPTINESIIEEVIYK